MTEIGDCIKCDTVILVYLFNISYISNVLHVLTTMENVLLAHLKKDLILLKILAKLVHLHVQEVVMLWVSAKIVQLAVHHAQNQNAPSVMMDLP